MSLLTVEKPEQPVFDTPPQSGIFIGFTMRRITTTAARSFFTEKNLPVQPSRDSLFKKCFSVCDNILYKLDREIQNKECSQISEHLSKEKLEFEIPAKYFFPKKSLRQKLFDPYVKAKTSCELGETTKETPDTLVPERHYPKSINFIDEIEIAKIIPFPAANFNFSTLQTQHQSTYTLLNPNYYSISSKKGLLIPPELPTTNKPFFTTELFNVCLYDLSEYFNNLNDKWRPIDYCKRNMPPVAEHEKIENVAYINSGEFIPTIKNDKELSFGKIKENFTFNERDNFAHFYIVAYSHLKPRILLDGFKIAANHVLDLPSSLYTKKKPQIVIAETKLKEQYLYDKPNKDQQSALKLPQINISINSSAPKKPDRIFTNKKAFIENQKIKVIKRYKSIRMALKLKINKPRFNHKAEKLSLTFSPKIKQKVFCSLLKKIFIKNITLSVEQKPRKSFDYSAKAKILASKFEFEGKNYKFINRCPKHCSYTRKALHKIICAAAFRKSRSMKYTFSNFKMPLLSKNLSYNMSFYSIKDCRLPPKSEYCKKETTQTLESHKPAFNNILFAQNKICQQTNSVCVLFDETPKINKNNLKSLKEIKYTSVIYDKTYHTAYTNAAKRIISKAQILHILDKANNTIYSTPGAFYNNKAKKSDIFKNKCSIPSAIFAEYLPKEIAHSLTLKLNICIIQKTKILSQREIIPPPYWKKKQKGYLCQISLGPYPFGFPDFAFAPQVFTQLISKANPSIIDLRAEKAVNQSNFILSKNKLYLPELSMKAPRRLLYSELAPQNQPKEFFVTDIEISSPKQNQPKTIKNFSQSWNLSDNWKCNNIFTYNTSEKISSKKPILATTKANNIKYPIKETTFKALTTCEMPKTASLLLSCINLKATSRKGEIAQFKLLISEKTILKETKPALPKHSNFADKICLPSIKAKKIPELSQAFSDFYSTRNAKPIYTARFRDFRFPYIPETSLNVYKAEKFYDFYAFDSTSSCRFQEDMGLTQFEFISAELTLQCNSSYNSINTSKRVETTSFNFSSKNSVSNTAIDFAAKRAKQPNIAQISTTTYCKHLISKKFFKLREFHSYKYKMPGKTQTLPSFKQRAVKNNSLCTFNEFCKDNQIPVLKTNLKHLTMQLNSGFDLKLSDDFGYNHTITALPAIDNLPHPKSFSTKEIAIVPIAYSSHLLAFPMLSKEKSELKLKANTNFTANNPILALNTEIKNISPSSPANLELKTAIPVKAMNFIQQKALDLKPENNSNQIVLSIAEELDLRPKKSKGIIYIPPFFLSSRKVKIEFPNADLKSEFSPLNLPDFIDITATRPRF